MRVRALLGSLKRLGEGSMVSNGNVPVSPVYPDPLGLTSTVMKVDTDKGKVEHSSVDMCRRRGVPLVMDAALAMAKGTAGIRSAGGADKATIAAPEALWPRAYGGAGGGAWGRCKRSPYGDTCHRADVLQQEGKRVLVESE